MTFNRIYIIILLCSLWAVFPFATIQAEGRDFTVVIDPGHGGRDPGAIGRRGKEKDINLKLIHLQGYDSTVFEMARQKKIAVTATHVPTAKYEGIKFVKISDWTGSTKLYFLRCPSNKSQALSRLEQCVNSYKKNL